MGERERKEKRVLETGQPATLYTVERTHTSTRCAVGSSCGMVSWVGRNAGIEKEAKQERMCEKENRYRRRAFASFKRCAHLARTCLQA